MKKLIFTSLLMSWAGILCAQYWLCDNYQLNFEDTFCLNQLHIDTVNYPGNIWQIGVPQKTVFSNAFSSPKAILTDTLLPYPANDTSVFTVLNTETGGGFIWPHTVVLGGFYKVNTDSLNDYGMIEFSPDNGNTWIDLIKDTLYSQYYFWSYPGPPTLTGNSNGWEEFSVYLAELGPVFNIGLEDTFLYRFTFISDSIQDSLDGLMFDDLWFEDWVEGIAEQEQHDLHTEVLPNPAAYGLRIEVDCAENESLALSIFSPGGKTVFKRTECRENPINIDAGSLQSGIYFYRIKSQDGRYGSGKIVISR